MEKEDRGKLIDAILFNLFFLLIIWVVWWVEEDFGWRLTKWGTRPRTLRGLIGIITTPFLHGSFEHISGNSLSFVSLSTFLIFFYRSIAFKVITLLYILSGILLWTIAFGGNHIGVSGVIYGLASFLFFSGIFRRNQQLLRVSLAVAFIYGSIVWWVLPIDPNISWEGHLAGSIVGIILAIVYRGEGGPETKKYQWEIDEEREAEEERIRLMEEVAEDIESEDVEDDPTRGWYESDWT
ncbi:MAG: rhomboid family intramembrane serine protease [Flavobacteriales bacterium]|nr:rhomboid family intramembrane serine protease [Flavobacteriales bacterium]